MSKINFAEMAEELGITVEKAQSIYKNIQGRRQYMKRYNQRPYVKAKRKEQNRRNNEIARRMKELGV